MKDENMIEPDKKAVLEVIVLKHGELVDGVAWYNYDADEIDYIFRQIAQVIHDERGHAERLRKKLQQRFKDEQLAKETGSPTPS